MVKGLLFDLNGTVINIQTSETDCNVFRTTACFLALYGINISANELKDKYFQLNRKQRSESSERFPEFDSAKIFEDIILEKIAVPTVDAVDLSRITSRVFRAASTYRLELYNGVYDTLTVLQQNCSMAAVSDGQSLWAEAELAAAGAASFFSFILVSGDFGFRKPDRRLFDFAVEKLGLEKDEILFVGNDMYRDIYGAKNAGLKSVFFKSNQGEQRYCGAEADYIIYDFPQLLKAVDFFNQ